MIYNEVLARNIRAARARADLQQEAVAARMRALGFSTWLRQTVATAEKGRRRVTAEEAIGLAVALDSTLPTLLTPASTDPVEFELGAGSGYPLSDTAIVGLIHSRASGVDWRQIDVEALRPDAC